MNTPLWPFQGFVNLGRRANILRDLRSLKGHLFSWIWGAIIGRQEKHFRNVARKVIFLSGSSEL